MSVLNTLFGNYADDITRAAANKLDDVARIAANKADDASTALGKLLSPEQAMPEYTTIYHNTPLDNVDSIVKNGIKADSGASKYADRSEVGVWGSRVKGDGYGGSTIAFRVPTNEAKKYMVNDTEYLIPRDISPEDIVDVDRMLVSSGGATLRQSQIPEKIAKYGEDKVVEVMKRLGADDNLIRTMLGKPAEVVDDMANKVDDMIKLYRGIAAPDEATLQRYIDDMYNPSIVPKTYSGGSAYGQGYYFTPAKDLAESYAFGKADMPAGAIMEIQVPRNRFTQISKELGNRPADFDFAAMQRGVPEDIRFETGLSDFQKYMDDNGFWGSVGVGENPNYIVMRNDALSTLKRLL